MKTAVLGLALCAGLAAGPRAEAATLSFVVDRAGSSVGLTGTGSLCLGTCGVKAALAGSLHSGDTYTLAKGESATFELMTLSGKGIMGWADYAVDAVLAFSSPHLSVSTTGTLFSTTVLGRIVGGSLVWDASPEVWIDGTKVRFSFGTGTGLFDDAARKLTTTVTIANVAAVPLPASGLLLAGALGGLGLARRRRARAA